MVGTRDQFKIMHNFSSLPPRKKKNALIQLYSTKPQVVLSRFEMEEPALISQNSESNVIRNKEMSGQQLETVQTSDPLDGLELHTLEQDSSIFSAKDLYEGWDGFLCSEMFEEAIDDRRISDVWKRSTAQDLPETSRDESKGLSYQNLTSKEDTGTDAITISFSLTPELPKSLDPPKEASYPSLPNSSQRIQVIETRCSSFDPQRKESSTPSTSSSQHSQLLKTNCHPLDVQREESSMPSSSKRSQKFTTNCRSSDVQRKESFTQLPSSNRRSHIFKRNHQPYSQNNRNRHDQFVPNRPRNNGNIARPSYNDSRFRSRQDFFQARNERSKLFNDRTDHTGPSRTSNVQSHHLEPYRPPNYGTTVPNDPRVRPQTHSTNLDFQEKPGWDVSIPVETYHESLMPNYMPKLKNSIPDTTNEATGWDLNLFQLKKPDLPETSREIPLNPEQLTPISPPQSSLSSGELDASKDHCKKADLPETSHKIPLNPEQLTPISPPQSSLSSGELDASKDHCKKADLPETSHKIPLNPEQLTPISPPQSSLSSGELDASKELKKADPPIIIPLNAHEHITQLSTAPCVSALSFGELNASKDHPKADLPETDIIQLNAPEHSVQISAQLSASMEPSSNEQSSHLGMTSKKRVRKRLYGRYSLLKKRPRRSNQPESNVVAQVEAALGHSDLKLTPIKRRGRRAKPKNQVHETTPQISRQILTRSMSKTIKSHTIKDSAEGNKDSGQNRNTLENKEICQENETRDKEPLMSDNEISQESDSYAENKSPKIIHRHSSDDSFYAENGGDSADHEDSQESDKDAENDKTPIIKDKSSMSTRSESPHNSSQANSENSTDNESDTNSGTPITTTELKTEQFLKNLNRLSDSSIAQSGNSSFLTNKKRSQISDDNEMEPKKPDKRSRVINNRILSQLEAAYNKQMSLKNMTRSNSALHNLKDNEVKISSIKNPLTSEFLVLFTQDFESISTSPKKNVLDSQTDQFIFDSDAEEIKNWIENLKHAVFQKKMKLKDNLMPKSTRYLINSLCMPLFTTGKCNTNFCRKLHKLKKQWFLPMKADSMWQTSHFFLSRAIDPLPDFYKSVLNWLGEKSKLAKILLLAEIFYNNLQQLSLSKKGQLWDCVLMAMMKCGMEKWEAIGLLVLFFPYSENLESSREFLKTCIKIDKTSRDTFYKLHMLLSKLGCVITDKTILELVAMFNKSSSTQTQENGFALANLVRNLKITSIAKGLPELKIFDKTLYSYLPSTAENEKIERIDNVKDLARLVERSPSSKLLASLLINLFTKKGWKSTRLMRRVTRFLHRKKMRKGLEVIRRVCNSLIDEFKKTNRPKRASKMLKFINKNLNLNQP